MSGRAAAYDDYYAEDVVRTTITVTVLARRSDMAALLENGGSLEDVQRFITDGEGIGTMGYFATDPAVVDPDELESVLLELGNDGSFFDDPDAGLDTDDESV